MKHALVTGGAGSGKTTIALLKAKARIEGRLGSGQSVLFLSFSRAAVARIVEASKTEIPGELQGALAIHTFHSFFWGIVRAYGYLLGAPKRLRILLPHDEKALRSGASEDNLVWQAERERLWREEGLVAFDLFAPKAKALLKGSETLCNLVADCHPLVIVDEAQDTADDQWACVRYLAKKSQLVCLADLEQQIYDFRPGVSGQRVAQIIESLDPTRVDLGTQNHRSAGTEILAFGNDILSNSPRGSAYKGVSQKGFRPNAEHRDAAIRSSIGIIRKKIIEKTGRPPASIALLATQNRGVTTMSRALRGKVGEKEISHRLLIDEATVLLSSRLIAFLLEPKVRGRELLDLAQALDHAAAVLRANGTQTSLSEGQRIAAQAEQARHGELPGRSKVASELFSLIGELQVNSFSGDPRKDWLDVRRRLNESKSPRLVKMAEEAEQLILLNRGARIVASFAEAWQATGSYVKARAILDAALAEEQILGGSQVFRGISVMTIHKAKGKEFDGVVIIDESRISPLTWREAPPYTKSRRLLRVGITRARHHVLLLTDLFNRSAILSGHKL